MSTVRAAARDATSSSSRGSPSSRPTSRCGATGGLSFYVPYTNGAAFVTARLRKPDAVDWYEEKELVVDTGAGITLFPQSIATELGLNLKSGQELTLTDVSGSKMNAWAHWIEIQFLSPGGKALPIIEIRAAFAETDNVPILVGRRDVLQELEIIFQDDGFTMTKR